LEQGLNNRKTEGEDLAKEAVSRVDALEKFKWISAIRKAGIWRLVTLLMITCRRRDENKTKSSITTFHN
jgi:hypothetical protein